MSIMLYMIIHFNAVDATSLFRVPDHSLGGVNMLSFMLYLE